MQVDIQLQQKAFCWRRVTAFHQRPRWFFNHSLHLKGVSLLLTTEREGRTQQMDGSKPPNHSWAIRSVLCPQKAVCFCFFSFRFSKAGYICRVFSAGVWNWGSPQWTAVRHKHVYTEDSVLKLWFQRKNPNNPGVFWLVHSISFHLMLHTSTLA